MAMRREDYMPFVLHVETIAAPITPTQAVAELCKLAGRLGIGVQTKINGADVFAFPGEQAVDVVSRWERATKAAPPTELARRSCPHYCVDCAGGPCGHPDDKPRETCLYCGATLFPAAPPTEAPRQCGRECGWALCWNRCVRTDAHDERECDCGCKGAAGYTRTEAAPQASATKESPPKLSQPETLGKVGEVAAPQAGGEAQATDLVGSKWRERAKGSPFVVEVTEQCVRTTPMIKVQFGDGSGGWRPVSWLDGYERIDGRASAEASGVGTGKARRTP